MTLPVCLVRQGDKYSLDYVRLLQQQIGNQAELICLTDRDCIPGVKAVPLVGNAPGWWAKMELFAPWNAKLRPFLFLDLDTYVLGAIAPVLADPGDKLKMLRDFYNPPDAASGVMIVPKDCSEIYGVWHGDPDGIMSRCKAGGDQQFTGHFCRSFLQDEYPGMISSYKVHSREEPTSPIVCFHGIPKPHEADGWAGDIWHKRPT
jgi:hypothetical protein